MGLNISIMSLIIDLVFLCRFVPRPAPANVKGDNSLLANTAVIKMATGLRDEDLVYVTFENKVMKGVQKIFSFLFIYAHRNKN